MLNLTEQREIRVPGCQSCPVKPSRKSRLQRWFFSNPGPTYLFSRIQRIVRILPTPLLRPLCEELKELGVVNLLQLMGDVHQKFLSHFKLNLGGLPDRSITEEMLAAVAEPLMQEV